MTQDSNDKSVSRRRFLLAAGSSAAGLGLGLGTLSLVAHANATRPGASRSGQALIAGAVNEASPGDETALVGNVAGPAFRVANRSLTPRSSALFVDVEGNVYQRSGIWIRAKANEVDTEVGVFVDNVGHGDGVYVENTDASDGASGIAIVNRSNSTGLNCLQDSSNTFFQVLKDPERNVELEGDFGDLMAFKDLRFRNDSDDPDFKRLDGRLLFVGGDCRLRTRVGIGNAEGIQMRRNQSVAAGLTSKDVSFVDEEATARDMVPEPDRNYGVVATPYWNTAVWVSNRELTSFRLNFSTPSPGGDQAYVSWIVFRDTL